MKNLVRLTILIAVLFNLSACGPRDTWDYVTLGDSLQVASTISEEYAKYIEIDQGVEVVLHQYAQRGTPPSSLLAKLQSNPEIRDAIANAEVITFNFSPGWGNNPESRYLKGECGGADNQDCLREALSKAKADWIAIVNEIIALKAGQPVLIRTFNAGIWIYDRAYEGSLTPEQKAEMSKYYIEMLNYIEQDAPKHGILVVRVFPEPYYHEELPPDDYLVGLHASEKGSKIVADLLRDLGYEFVVLK